MALLLRMGGIPARVVTGFTTGTYDSAEQALARHRRRRPRLGRGVVPALRLGHVRPDAGGGARARRQRADLVDRVVQQLGRARASQPARRLRPAARPAAAPASTSSGSLDTVLLATLGVLAVLFGVALVAWRRTAPLGPDGLLAELERALARSGRPITDGVTLAAVERRFRTSPGGRGRTCARCGCRGTAAARRCRRSASGGPCARNSGPGSASAARCAPCGRCRRVRSGHRGRAARRAPS